MSWQLGLSDSSDYPHHAATISGFARPFGKPAPFGKPGDSGDVFPTIISTAADNTAGFDVYYEADRELDGEVEVSGAVIVNHHGPSPAGFPATDAVIVRVEVEQREHVREEGTNNWAPSTESPSYRSVDVSPTVFDLGPRPGSRAIIETGVRVRLRARLAG